MNRQEQQQAQRTVDRSMLRIYAELRLLEEELAEVVAHGGDVLYLAALLMGVRQAVGERSRGLKEALLARVEAPEDPPGDEPPTRPGTSRTPR